MGAALLTACEQKETTVTNPPAEKKESNTTIVNPSPATKTDINVNTSPSVNDVARLFAKSFVPRRGPKDFCCTPPFSR